MRKPAGVAGLVEKQLVVISKIYVRGHAGLSFRLGLATARVTYTDEPRLLVCTLRGVN